MFITSVLSLVTCPSRHGSRDTLVFPFDLEKDNVDWLEEAVNNAFDISLFLVTDNRQRRRRTTPLWGLTDLLRGAFDFEQFNKRL